MFKSIFKAVAVSAVAAVFSIGCSDGDGGNTTGPVAREAKTYTGTAEGVTYTLKIEDGGPRAALTPTSGDKFTLTQDANTKKSTGTVTKAVGGVLTLAPKEGPDDEFTATVSGDNITAMSGNITWDDGTADEAPETLTPSGGIGPGPGGNPSIKKESFTDSRDGKSYSSVKIGTQTWMAENLNYDVEDSKCYDNDPANCEKYGRLYTWYDAMVACPAGWHLPDTTEWNTLENYIGGASTAVTKLKSTEGWYDNRNGTDDYGFAALPGGRGSLFDNFYDAGNEGQWWSSTESEAGGAWYRAMFYNSYGEFMGGGVAAKVLLRSVRCVAD